MNVKKKERNNMYGLPISCKGITHYSEDIIVFHIVTFEKDFGIFEKDTKLKDLSFNFKESKIYTFIDKHEIFQYITIQPKH